MGTDFDNRTHEEMLKWLDQASSGEIQGAADRLKSAASEIHKIAQDLKIRPQWVEWKGEGAEAFRTWSADLANATLRLGDYSEAASECLGEASHAVALAQASIPRPHAGDQANLDAALAARNDPDAVALAKTLIATKEKDREEAAAQMRKLAQTYTFSSSQMTALAKPVFPAVPQVIAPGRAEDKAGGRSDYDRRRGISNAAAGYASNATVSARGPESEGREAAQAGTVSAPSSAVHAVPRPVGMDVDSVAVLPETSAVPTVTPPSLPTGGTVDRGTPPGPGGFPPIVSTSPVSPTTGSNRTPGGGRLPLISSGRVSQAPGPVGRPAGESGIVGGRPAPQASGRPTGGLPRGTVVGGEGTHSSRGPMMHGMGTGGLGGGQNGVVGGRRSAGETGGVVGGRPQQPGRTSARPFTPGGTGLVRSAEGAGVSSRTGRSGTAPQRKGNARRDESEERPNYLTEDEATWRNGRPVVPPVID